MARIVFTAAQRAYIRSHFRIESAQRMADRFGCSREPVRRYMQDHGLVPTDQDRFNIQSNSNSTALLSEDNFITRHHLTMPIKQMAARLGRSQVFVRTRLDVLGLVIPPEVRRKHAEDSRIKKGSTPFNKGKKMSKEQYRKCARTMFGKGKDPANTLHDGAITIRKDNRGVPQLHIRLSKARWDFLSRHTYRQHYGPIPRDSIVIFRDGNTLNCDPTNLELMTKADNARRNHDSRYPPEVREVIRLNNRLKKAIRAKK